VEGQVVRRLAGPLVLLHVTGRRLVAWMQDDAEPGDRLYLEVTSPMPSPRFRRITGGASFWSLPIGRSRPDRLDAMG
jgi:hypothetical protein